MPSEAATVLRSFVSTTSSTRGWFVTLLTDERYDAVFKPPLDPVLLSTIEASPEPNNKLLIMNIATSSVVAANGGEDRAAASRLTRDRSKVLLNALFPRMRGLVEEAQQLRTAVVPWPSADTPPESADKEWIEFTRDSEYGEEERAAIKAVLDEVLAPYDEVIPSGLWKSPEIWAVVGYGGYALAIGADPVFCPEGPTSLQAYRVAQALTSTVLVGWAGYVATQVQAAVAKPQEQ